MDTTAILILAGVFALVVVLFIVLLMLQRDRRDTTATAKGAGQPPQMDLAVCCKG